MTAEIISRAEARARGLRHFFVAQPCKHGHSERRLVSDGSCMACRRVMALKNHYAAKDVNNAQRRQRRAANIDAERLTGREYRNKHLERERARTAEWQAANAQWRADYAKKNAAAFVRYAQSRRAQKLKATPLWYGEFDDFVLRECIDLCHLRRAATGIEWEVDHMVPLRAKEALGLHCASNFQVIPASMNSSKRNRMTLTTPLEWLRYL